MPVTVRENRVVTGTVVIVSVRQKKPFGSTKIANPGSTKMIKQPRLFRLVNLPAGISTQHPVPCRLVAIRFRVSCRGSFLRAAWTRWHRQRCDPARITGWHLRRSLLAKVRGSCCWWRSYWSYWQGYSSSFYRFCMECSCRWFGRVFSSIFFWAWWEVMQGHSRFKGVGLYHMYKPDADGWSVTDKLVFKVG